MDNLKLGDNVIYKMENGIKITGVISKVGPDTYEVYLGNGKYELFFKSEVSLYEKKAIVKDIISDLLPSKE